MSLEHRRLHHRKSWFANSEAYLTSKTACVCVDCTSRLLNRCVNVFGQFGTNLLRPINLIFCFPIINLSILHHRHHHHRLSYLVSEWAFCVLIDWYLVGVGTTDKGRKLVQLMDRTKCCTAPIVLLPGALLIEVGTPQFTSIVMLAGIWGRQRRRSA